MILLTGQKPTETSRRLVAISLACLFGSLIHAAPASAEPQTTELNRAIAISNAHHTEVTEGYANLNQTWVDDTGAAPSTRSANRSYLIDLDIWVANVGVRLFDDQDQDGYFSGFSVTLDVDVDGDWADVYAVIYLQPRGNSISLLHTTNVFSIYRRASSDAYEVDVRLTDHFRADDHDVLIDIVNANTGLVADTISRATHRNLEGLPLESLEFQANLSAQPPNTAFGNSEPSVRPLTNAGNGYNNDYNNYDNGYYDSEYSITYSLSLGSDGYYDYYGYNSGYYSNSGVGFGVSLSSTRHGGAAGWLSLLTLGLGAGLRKYRRAG